MKRLLGIALLLSVATVGVYASDLPSREIGYVSVNTEASEDFAPNMAKITFSIQTYNKEMAKATEENKQAATSAIAAVKKLLDSTKGETVKTTSFNVTPEYTWKNNVKSFVRYSASNSFEVTIKDTSKLGKIISAGLDNGANSVSNLDYSLDNNSSACNGLIQQATGLAKIRATATAQALGSGISGIKSINAQCSTGEYYQPRYSNMAAMKSSAGGAEDSSSNVSTEEGTIKLRATVNAQFYLK